MNITVINASPKPEHASVTMRHVEFLKNNFKEHKFTEIPVALKIRMIEHNRDYFSDIINTVNSSDIVLWAFPVYFYSIPGQLKRFIEIVIEEEKTYAFSGKYSSVIATSAGIYDYPALDYIQATSEDFGMEYFPGCSFKSLYHKDLLRKEVRDTFSAFFRRLILNAEDNKQQIKKYPKIVNAPQEFQPSDIPSPASEKNGKKLLVLTDQKNGSNLEKMVYYAVANSGFEHETVNINDIDFRSGCIGCMQCQFNGRCVIKDDVNGLFGKKILTFDAVLFAISMQDRHISARWKTLIDRTLFIAKKNVYRDIHSGFIVSGPAMQGGFVHEFLQIYAGSRYFHDAGIVTDESGDSIEISANLVSLMHQLETSVVEKIQRPYLFHQRAYHMAMRELIYINGLGSNTQKFYRKNGLFDYPNTTLKHIISRSMLNFFFTFPLTKKHFRKNINIISANQYRKVTV